MGAIAIALGFAARQCFGLTRKTEKPLPADEQIGDDAGRAAVETRVRDQFEIPYMGVLDIGADLVEPRRQPRDAGGTSFFISIPRLLQTLPEDLKQAMMRSRVRFVRADDSGADHQFVGPKLSRDERASSGWLLRWRDDRRGFAGAPRWR